MLYRGIGECAWNKGEYLRFTAFQLIDLLAELYLLAFGPLREVFEPHELNAFANTMAERQIRMRTGLDAILDIRESVAAKEVEEDSSNSESEIEHNARELRRLMPY